MNNWESPRGPLDDWARVPASRPRLALVPAPPGTPGHASPSRRPVGDYLFAFAIAIYLAILTALIFIGAWTVAGWL